MKRKSARVAVVLAGFLSISMVGPIAALAGAPQHRDQVPGYFRLKVGDLEVTSLFDGGAQFDTNWLRGSKADMADIATKISAELRNQYVLGYKSDDAKRDGKWRKLKVKLVPPQGLPLLSVHARTGYYAPLQ